ncbi:MAG: ABC transporter ATP-binding protein [Spirochaetales bacterium]|nr:ABC transporter ATP-binding protein [Spirochaetales bacterium]
MIEIKNLRVEFETEKGTLKALRGIDFQVFPGEILGIVGESGSGKSVTATSMMGLLPKRVVKSGEILIDGTSVLSLSRNELSKIRGNKISMIFQEPGRSFDPLYSIGKTFSETLLRNNPALSREQCNNKSIELLKEVGIPNPEERLNNFPHQLSGGQLQRVMIALAVAANPSYLIADEPTTALDVTIQGRIVRLLKEMKEKYNLAVIFITHDLSLIQSIADKILVMYSGLVLEYGKAAEVLSNPLHPYTQGLLSSIPRPGANYRTEKLVAIPGNIPDPTNPPPGCPFAPRCKYAKDICRENVSLKTLQNNRQYRCIREV